MSTDAFCSSNEEILSGLNPPETMILTWENPSRSRASLNAMIDTAENVAKENGITKEMQDEVTYLRYQQYEKSLADDRAFQKRYMLGPIEIKNRKGKVLATVERTPDLYPAPAPDTLISTKSVE